MKNQNGFTLIELMICVVIAIILGSIIFAGVNGAMHGDEVSWGYNGVVETRCIEGTKVLVSDGGRYGGTDITQLLDQEGHPIPCAKK
jgi:prepilin-type N-terminal cleavage/methylation domain-containing protein